MKKDGFISVLALLIIVVVFANCIYIFHLVSLQSHIARNSQKNIQSRIIADHKVNLLLFDNNNLEHILKPELYRILRNTYPPYKNRDENNDGVPDGNIISIPGNTELGSNILSVKVRLQGSQRILNMSPIPMNYDETTTMILNIETEYEGIHNFVEIKARIINKIFEIEEPYISELRMMEHDLMDEFNHLMDFMEAEIFDHDPKGTSAVVKLNLEGDGLINEQYIVEVLEDMNKNHTHRSKHMLLNIIASDHRPNIEIRHSRDRNERVFLRGNIYCEGDLIISSPFELEGNLILNNGNILLNTDAKPIIKGKVFYRGDGAFNPCDINLDSEKRHIYLYGSYLPGFIDIKIDVIKK